VDNGGQQHYRQELDDTEGSTWDDERMFQVPYPRTPPKTLSLPRINDPGRFSYPIDAGVPVN
jgi:hypothetical protein